jgi:hypothetical protein
MTPLETFIAGYAWLIRQPGQGINTPLSRQVKQPIKIIFKAEGVAAIQAEERKLLSERGVRPSFQPAPRKTDREASGGATSERRAARLAQQNVEAEAQGLVQARMARLQRQASRNPQTVRAEPPPKSDKKEDVVEVKPQPFSPVSQPVISAGGEDIVVKPLNTAEAKQIVEMNGGQAVNAFTGERIRATLKAFNDPTINMQGSDKQLAHRLIARLKG